MSTQQKMKTISVTLVFACWVILAFVYAQNVPAAAASPPENRAALFYKGKTVELVVPYPPGGNFDIMARLILPYLSQQLGATVIVRNEPGAGGKVALNRLAKESDGLSLITLHTLATVTAQLFKDAGVRYDLTKFNWLGTISRDQQLVVVSKNSEYKSLADLRKAQEIKFGAQTRGSAEAFRALEMGYLLGVHVKLVTGYKGLTDEMMALQRGEIGGLAMSARALLPYILSKDVVPFIAIEKERIKFLPDVPTIVELKQGKLSAQEQKVLGIGLLFDEVSRPIATTPGVPRERVAFLEAAMERALRDPDLLEKAEKVNLSIDYASAKHTSNGMKAMVSIEGEEKAVLGKLLGIEGY